MRLGWEDPEECLKTGSDYQRVTFTTSRYASTPRENNNIKEKLILKHSRLFSMYVNTRSFIMGTLTI